MHSFEHRKQAKEALSPVLLKIIKLKETAEGLDQYLDQFIKDSNLETSAELAANDCGGGSEKGAWLDAISIAEVDIATGVLKVIDKKKTTSAVC